MAICKKCNSQLAANAKFCGKCGMSIGASDNSGDMLEKAISLFNAERHTEAFPLVKILAEQGEREAQFCMGYYYEFSKFVESDEVEMMSWYYLAAKQGQKAALKRLKDLSDDYDTEAEYRLAMLYEFGYGVEQDIEKAIELYREAAYSDHAGAQFCLGYCLASGEGGDEDLEEAVEWFQKAAAQGHEEAQKALDDLAQFNSEEQKTVW